MPIMIKKSKKLDDKVQLIAPTQESVEINHSILEDVGFLDEVVAVKGKFLKGQRVKVILPPYPWTVIWQLGDVGTVIRTWEATREFKTLGEGWGVVAVEMDIVRHPEWNLIYFAEKDLEVIP